MYVAMSQRVNVGVYIPEKSPSGRLGGHGHKRGSPRCRWPSFRDF